MDPVTLLNNLLSNLPGYALISPEMKEAALAQALIPDAAGVWPGQPGYVPTVDPYFAAVSLIGFLQAQPVVRQTSSEGTSVAVDAPNWDGLILYYKSMSPIFQAIGPTVLNKVLIPDGPHVVRTNMREAGEYYDNVDTDLG